MTDTTPTRIGRFVRLAAQEGRGGEVAGLLLRVAATLATAPGCESYVVHRSATEPDTVWVSEVWASQEALATSADVAATDGVHPNDIVEILTSPPQIVELVPVGGVGLPTG